MNLRLLCMFCLLKIVPFHIFPIPDISDYGLLYSFENQKEECISSMEALDLVKEHYAANFDKVYLENSDNQYIYKLRVADYYLEYAGEVGVEKDYLIHLYEFVVDEPETGLGHTVTYGWYIVDRESRVISEQTQ